MQALALLIILEMMEIATREIGEVIAIEICKDGPHKHAEVFMIEEVLEISILMKFFHNWNEFPHHAMFPYKC
jgi:hypothetical protein